MNGAPLRVCLARRTVALAPRRASSPSRRPGSHVSVARVVHSEPLVQVRHALVVVLCAAVAACDASGAGSLDAGSPAIVAVEAGYANGGDDGALGCSLDGDACSEPSECCSGTCTRGVCGAGPYCSPPGAPCSSPAACCSHECALGLCADDSAPPPPAPCTPSAPACGDAGACCGGACLGGYCSSCATPLGAGACPVCIGNACCDAIGACLGDPACAAFLQCVLSCEGDGGTGYACALGPCRPDADAITLPVVQCYASSCTAECHGS